MTMNPSSLEYSVCRYTFLNVLKLMFETTDYVDVKAPRVQNHA